ncbi:hypothetical protein NC00_02870 [Xanthomonas cannabis pv. phaseoli]|uniref:Uncharacterized protein n=1 Tax=Xanthomonas cannabis pv. phaseoli TaxID=1885902 RepID=A0AB34PCK0_9XANT|nr:hypothetical protein NC00_02870 [Xanthomonas cannabis pv. phaseoli]
MRWGRPRQPGGAGDLHRARRTGLRHRPRHPQRRACLACLRHGPVRRLHVQCWVRAALPARGWAGWPAGRSPAQPVRR